MKTLDEALSIFQGDASRIGQIGASRLSLLQEISANGTVASYLRSAFAFMAEQLPPEPEKETPQTVREFERWLLMGYLFAFQTDVLTGIEMEKQELSVGVAP